MTDGGAFGTARTPQHRLDHPRLPGTRGIETDPHPGGRARIAAGVSQPIVETAASFKPSRRHHIALAAIFGLLALLTFRQISSLDAGFHLKSGEYILSGHFPPTSDIFAYTLRDHPVVNMTWGYDAV